MFIITLIHNNVPMYHMTALPFYQSYSMLINCWIVKTRKERNSLTGNSQSYNYVKGSLRVQTLLRGVVALWSCLITRCHNPMQF